MLLSLFLTSRPCLFSHCKYLKCSRNEKKRSLLLLLPSPIHHIRTMHPHSHTKTCEFSSLHTYRRLKKNSKKMCSLLLFDVEILLCAIYQYFCYKIALFSAIHHIRTMHPPQPHKKLVNFPLCTQKAEFKNVFKKRGLILKFYLVSGW